MNVRLCCAPWVKFDCTDETKEAIKIMGNDIWKEASIKFIADRDYKNQVGKNAPKGMQRFLNEILNERFEKNGWFANSGYFLKGRTWIRVTFRHQMSLGSDILDAIKVCKLEKIEQAIILAANSDTLQLISPNDANALISFEKLLGEIWSLNGALDIPLLIGELTPLTSASQEIEKELRKNRLRDKTVPSKN